MCAAYFRCGTKGSLDAPYPCAWPACIKAHIDEDLAPTFA